jgi:hypothetical protein
MANYKLAFYYNFLAETAVLPINLEWKEDISVGGQIADA